MGDVYSLQSHVCSPLAILSCLDISTSEPIKHLSGLDSIDTECRTMNFKEMQSINTALAKPLQKTMGNSKAISESINESIMFHKTKFRSHLQCEGHHICQYLSCRFTHPDQDKTDGHHSDFSNNKDFDCKTSIDVGSTKYEGVTKY